VLVAAGGQDHTVQLSWNGAAAGGRPISGYRIYRTTVPASNPRGTEILKNAILAMPDVQTVQIDSEWVERLTAMLAILHRIIWLTAALLGVGVVLVVGNTIRLDILNRRAEIEVMKLVGATDGFARRPFLYSGVWYGLGGGVLAVLLVAAAVASLAKPVERLAGLYGSQLRLNGLGFGWGVAVMGVSIMPG
jgi:cell division transport system permease protein